MMRTQREIKDKEAIWAWRGRTRESANWSGREHRRLVESSLPVAQIDVSQPITSTEEEGNRNKGNEEAFSSDQSAIAVTEGEETRFLHREPKTVKDAECQTIEFDYMFLTNRYQAPNKDLFWHWRYSSLLHWATIYRFLEKYPLEIWIIWRLWSWAHRFPYNCLQFHTSHGHQHGGNLICIRLWRQLKTKNCVRLHSWRENKFWTFCSKWLLWQPATPFLALIPMYWKHWIQHFLLFYKTRFDFQTSASGRFQFRSVQWIVNACFQCFLQAFSENSLNFLQTQWNDFIVSRVRC